MRFAMPLVPVVTLMALRLRIAVFGHAGRETMFGIQGMEKRSMTICSRISTSPVTGLLLATIVTCMASLVADFAYGWLDPRITSNDGSRPVQRSTPLAPSPLSGTCDGSAAPASARRDFDGDPGGTGRILLLRKCPSPH